MSTNGNRPLPASTRVMVGGSRAIEETRGMRDPSEMEAAIKEQELAYPIGGDPWSVMGFEDPSIMRLRRDVELSDLRQMTQRDGHARAMLNVLTWPLRAASRVVEPFEDGEEEADFIRNMLELPPHRGGMTTTMDYIISSHGLAFRDGFKVFEIVNQVVEMPMPDGSVRFPETLRKLVPLPSDTIGFRYDDHGGFDGVVQTIYWKGEKRVVPLPREKCLLFTVNKEESPLEGESLFLPAYYHYDKKHRLYYIAHIAAQVGAIGLRVGKLGPSTDAARAKFLKGLQDLGLGGAMVAPLGAEIDVHNATSILSDILALIEHHDISMSKSILAHFLDVGTEGKGGLGTATTTSELGDLFVVALEAHLKNIAEGITSYLIPYYIDRNFGTQKYPTFRFEPFSDETKALLADTFKSLFSAANLPEAPMLFEMQRRFAEALGLEGIDWDELKQRFDEEQEAKKELEAVARDAQKKALENPEPAPAPPGGGGPPRPAPANLAEPPTLEGVQRTLRLAEAITSGRQVLDRFGRPMVAGDRVTLEDSDSMEFGSGDAIYLITEVVGSTLVLERVRAEDDDSYNPGPIAKAANQVRLLA